MRYPLSIGALLSILLAGASFAHEGPTEIIQRLSHRIDAGGGSADDYQRRATEWRILGKSDRAARDLRLALRKDPSSRAAWRELARVSLLLNDPNGAIESARQALELSDRMNTKRPSTADRVLLAEILLETERADRAREVIDEAFSLCPEQDVDAWWLRAEILVELDDKGARLDCLKAGWQQTGSEALRIAWIDTSIELGKVDTVIPQIEESLARCRLKAAWRIRRARVAMLLDNVTEAQSDLQLAMAELERRLHPARPDRTVVKDLASARQLLKLVSR